MDFLDLSTRELLRRFGAGSHKPGSGSASSLLGLLAGHLLLTVCKLTRSKEHYSNVHNQMFERVAQLERVIALLEVAFARDATVIHDVVTTRQRRDRATDPEEKQRLGDEARDRLRVATDLPLEICEHCITIGEVGLYIFDSGFRAARGDSGTAISTAVAGAQSALFIAYLNLTQFPVGDWLLQERATADRLAGNTRSLEEGVKARLGALVREGETANILTFQGSLRP